jgi:hypothetical protein
LDAVRDRDEMRDGALDADVPGGADDGEADAQGDAHAGPGVGVYGFEEGADVEGLALAVEEHVCGPLARAGARRRVNLHRPTTPKAAAAPPVP